MSHEPTMTDALWKLLLFWRKPKESPTIPQLCKSVSFEEKVRMARAVHDLYVIDANIALNDLHESALLQNLILRAEEHDRHNRLVHEVVRLCHQNFISLLATDFLESLRINEAVQKLLDTEDFKQRYETSPESISHTVHHDP